MARKRTKISLLALLLCCASSVYVEEADFFTDELVVEVALDAQGLRLQELVDGKYTIDSVWPDAARLYVSPEEFAALKQAGYNPRLLPHPGLSAEKDDSAYHSYATLTSDLQSYATAYPALCRLSSLGQSVQGRELWAILITDNPDLEEDEPEFKYIATMHGDEPPGTEMCMNLIDRLLTDYGVDAAITRLVERTEIWILPLMNPDGLEQERRYNANGYDLNRSFPVYDDDFVGTQFDGEDLDDAGRQPEVAHVMRWTAENSFVLSANFHTGALVVNYPYDDDGFISGQDAPTPDDLLFEELSHRYAVENSPMYNSTRFPGGIVNGTVWYTTQGSIQDWSYRYAACMDVTIEISDTKWPSASILPSLWEDNEAAMLAYMESVHMGVRGLVTDRNDDAPLWAQISVAGNTQAVPTDPDVGDYHRLLLPGFYNLSVYAPGYIPYQLGSVVVSSGDAVRRDAPLSNGDLDKDGSVGATDIQLVVNAVLGMEVGVDADVDGQGLSATDIQAVINCSLGRPIAR